MSWKLSASVSRYSVIFVALGTTALLGTHWYQRAIDGNPITLAKDGEGVVRFMTKLEALEARAESSQRLAIASPDDTARAAVAEAWQHAAQDEAKRMRLAGVETQGVMTTRDLEL